MRTQVWSCGGGVQSAFIAYLITEGRMPKPDIAVMIDTERERQTTWEYVNGTIAPRLAAVGVELHVVKKSEFSTVDLWSTNGDLLLPVFTQGGKFPAYCSGEWKRDVMMRWLRSRGVEQCDNWLGISLDEAGRIRSQRVKWLRNVYPLVEMRIRRQQCLTGLELAGWPEPPRSSCWMCSNQNQSEWDGMTADDWARAVELDNQIEIEDSGMFLHYSRVRLRNLENRGKSTQMGIFAETACASGYCFV